jgi:hypothetical protein
MSDRLGSGKCPERILDEALHIGALLAAVDCTKQGLSDSLIFDFCWAGERRAIKGWPDSSGRFRQLQSTHQVQMAIGKFLNQSKTPSLVGTPSRTHCADELCRIPTIHPWSSGQTILSCNHRLWEWGSWLEGSSCYYDSFQQHHLQEAMVAVEKIHAASLAIGTDVGKSPRWDRRIALYRQLLSLDRRSAPSIAPQSLASHPKEFDPTPVIQDLWDGWRKITPQSFRPLIDAISPLFQRQWIVGDLWRDHILFADNLPCGIIDWGATSWDWRGWDWIRLLTTTPFWNRAEAWRWVAQGFEENLEPGPWHSHSSLEEKTLRLAELGRLQIYLTAGQWILWAGQVPQQQVLFQSKSHRRLTELVAQLTSWHLGHPPST